MVLKSLARWFGGIFLFFGLLFIIYLYSATSSGILSPHFTQTAISSIINYSTSSSASLLNSSVNNANLSAAVSAALSKISNQPNCSFLCALSSTLYKSTGINIPMSNSDISIFAILADVFAAAGVVLIFLSYKGYKRFQAVGRNTIAAAILSFISVYVPFTFIIPFFVQFPVAGYTIRIPPTLFAPFTSVLLMFDIIFGVIGAAVLVVSLILARRETRFAPKPPLDQGPKTAPFK